MPALSPMPAARGANAFACQFTHTPHTVGTRMDLVREADVLLNAAVRDVGQGRVGEIMGIGGSRMSELMQKDLIGRTAKLIAACGMRLVPAEAVVAKAGQVVIGVRELHALEDLAEARIAERKRVREAGASDFGALG